MAAVQREDSWKLIQPELMSLEELLKAVQERNITIEEKVRCNKQQLVDLYRRVAMPLSQRTCFRKKVCSSAIMEVDLPHNHKNGDRQMDIMSKCPQTQVNGSITGNNQLVTTKIRLKRPANEHHIVQEDKSQNGPTPRKREKITWP